MKKIYKTIDGREIIHQHLPSRRTVRFIPCDQNGNPPSIGTEYPVIEKYSVCIDWDNPFTQEELEFISSPLIKRKRSVK